jgi:hypothetical protein
MESKYIRTKRKKLYQYISNGIEIYKDKKKETVPINIYWNRNIQGQKEGNCTNAYLMESKYTGQQERNCTNKYLMESKYTRTKIKKMWRGKSAIRSHNSKNRQCNGQMKIDKH